MEVIIFSGGKRVLPLIKCVECGEMVENYSRSIRICYKCLTEIRKDTKNIGVWNSISNKAQTHPINYVLFIFQIAMFSTLVVIFGVSGYLYHQADMSANAVCQPVCDTLGDGAVSTNVYLLTGEPLCVCKVDKLKIELPYYPNCSAFPLLPVNISNYSFTP